jgi:hypothetical protein
MLHQNESAQQKAGPQRAGDCARQMNQDSQPFDTHEAPRQPTDDAAEHDKANQVHDSSPSIEMAEDKLLAN